MERLSSARTAAWRNLGKVELSIIVLMRFRIHPVVVVVSPMEEGNDIIISAMKIEVTSVVRATTSKVICTVEDGCYIYQKSDGDGGNLYRRNGGN